MALGGVYTPAASAAGPRASRAGRGRGHLSMCSDNPPTRWSPQPPLRLHRGVAGSVGLQARLAAELTGNQLWVWRSQGGSGGRQGPCTPTRGQPPECHLGPALGAHAHSCSRLECPHSVWTGLPSLATRTPCKATQPRVTSRGQCLSITARRYGGEWAVGLSTSPSPPRRRAGAQAPRARGTRVPRTALHVVSGWTQVLSAGEFNHCWQGQPTERLGVP